MAAKTDSGAVRAILEKQLQPGEFLKNWAVGTKRAGPKTWLGLFLGVIGATLILGLLGIRGGIIGTPLWILLIMAIMAPISRAADKHYAVGLSDRRLFGLTLRPKLWSAAIDLDDRTGSFECPIEKISEATAKRRIGGAVVRVNGPGVRVTATCADSIMDGNKEQWDAIVAGASPKQAQSA